MIRHYLLIAFRSFNKNKAYSLLNTFGLALGVTCALIIFLYVHDELTYDRHHENGENIYRLNAAYHLPNNGGFEQYAAAGPMVGEVVAKDFPEVEQVVRLRRMPDVVVAKPDTDERSYELFFAADSNVFKVFTLPFVLGNPEQALLDINTVVLTQSMARKYFNREDVVGERLRLPEDSIDLKITGVMQDYPVNTHLKFDFVISLETYRTARHVFMQNWWNYSFQTYLQLVPQAHVAGLEEKVKFISRQYIKDQEDGSGYRQEYSLTHFPKIHLYSNLRTEIEPNAKASYVYIFLVIGIFVLVIACINFMNLATARSAMRAKEIGLRKVAGALRPQLVGQFLGEAFMMTLLAVTVAVIALLLLLPGVNEFSGKNLTLFSGSFFWLALAGITLFVALLAGTYPAIFLSAFRPVETLKGNFRNSAKGNGLRKALVVFQFSISIFLIAGTLIVMNHLGYIRAIDLGFIKERIVFIPTHLMPNAARDYKIVKDEFLKISGVESATLSSRVPGKELGNNVVRLGWDEGAAWSDMRFLAVDPDFVETYHLELVEGRSFNEDFPSDENEAFLVNEAGVRRLGFASAKEAIGQKLKWQDRNGYVVGVLKDFHFMSANVAIEPFLMVMNKPWSVGYLSVKLSSENLIDKIGQMKEVFQKILPGRIFEYTFLDADFDKQYKSEDGFMTLVSFFAVIAILIACLGLYGLALFMAELRYKEVGIRKVLGASENSLLVLLTSDFLKLVAIAFVVASPVAYWALDQWLNTFPYREKINPLVMGAAGLSALIIALLTVSYQAVKASRVNPVKSIAGN
jgi:putative ABC transport system permease protein